MIVIVLICKNVRNLLEVSIIFVSPVKRKEPIILLSWNYVFRHIMVFKCFLIGVTISNDHSKSSSFSHVPKMCAKAYNVLGTQ